jgi:hypothetical protein
MGRLRYSVPRLAVYTRWLEVPAPEAVETQLAAALAELHTEAGWCCYDEGVDGAGHFTRALKLADKAGDACGIANAAWHAGLVQIRNGHPNDALKLFQLGHFRLKGFAPGKEMGASRCLRARGGIFDTASIQLDLGQLDAAEGSAANAVRSLSEGHYRRGHTIAELLLAGCDGLGKLSSRRRSSYSRAAARVGARAW